MEDNSGTSTILLMAKVGAMVGLGCGSLVLGMLPLIVGRCQRRRRDKRRRAISANSSASTTTSGSNGSTSSGDSAPADSQGLLTSLLLCFGGGVLLFTTFLHLAPEVRASVERHQSNGQLPILGSLSLAELLFCGGFFLVYLVEEAVHAALTGKPESSDALLYRTVSVRRCNNQTGVASGGAGGSTTTVSTTTRSTWKDERDERDERDETDDLEECCDDRRLDRPVSKFARRFEEIVQGSKDQEALPAIFVLSSPVGLTRTVRDTPELEPEITGFPKIRAAEQHEHQHQHRHEHRHEHEHQHQHQHQHLGSPGKDSSVQGLLTVLALSFHAIFEGLAVGLEPAIGSVVYLAAAIATHKLVISFCVGMELYVAGASSRTTLGYLTVFSMVTPIGIAVGLALGHFKNDSENLGATPTILQGMAAGTLLYVVFFEVLARERANDKSGLLQLAAIILGFMLMLSLQILTAHSHSHGGHGHGHEHGHERGYTDGGDGHTHSHEEEPELGSGENHLHVVHGKETSESILSGAIERVTESIGQVLSTALTLNSTRH